MNELRFTGWILESPIEPGDIGETIIINAKHTDGNWATLLLNVKERDEENDLWTIELETVLDGSDGILEAYLASKGID